MTQIVWMGPVSLAQVGDTSLPGAKVGLIQCKGDVVPTCGNIADAWPATKVASMLGTAHLDPADLGDVIIRAFSAGGSNAKRVLLGSDWNRATAVVLSDATYTSWQSPGNPLPPEGFVRFAIEAIGGNKAFVATASSAPNGSLPNGSQTLESIKNEIERRSGVIFVETDSIPGMPMQPQIAWVYGAVLLADYGNIVTHSQHATLLAEPIWQNVVRPWLIGATGEIPTTPSPPKPILAPASPGNLQNDYVPWHYWAFAGGAMLAGALAINELLKKMA